MVSELGSKIRFTFCFLLSFYLFRFCSYSLFFVFVLCTKWKKKKRKRKRKKKKWYWSTKLKKKREVILKQQILSFYLLKVTLFLNCDFSSFSSLKQKKKKKNLIFFLFPHWLVVSAIYFLAVGIGLNSASWISWLSLLVSGRTEKEKLWVEKGKRVWD